MIGNILCIAAGYALAQFLSIAKLKALIARFRKDGVGEADEYKAGGTSSED